MKIMIIIIFFLTTVKNEMFFEEIKDCTEGLRIHEKLQKQRRNLYQRTWIYQELPRLHRYVF